VINAVYLLWIGVAARERCIEYPYGEQEISVFEPGHVIRHSGLGGFVAQRLEIAREAVDGVKRSRVVRQPMRQIGHRFRMRNVMALDQVSEQDGVKVFLVDLDSQVSSKAGDFGETARLPILPKSLVNEKPLLCR